MRHSPLPLGNKLDETLEIHWARASQQTVGSLGPPQTKLTCSNIRLQLVTSLVHSQRIMAAAVELASTGSLMQTRSFRDQVKRAQSRKWNAQSNSYVKLSHFESFKEISVWDSPRPGPTGLKDSACGLRQETESHAFWHCNCKKACHKRLIQFEIVQKQAQIAEAEQLPADLRGGGLGRSTLNSRSDAMYLPPHARKHA